MAGMHVSLYQDLSPLKLKLISANTPSLQFVANDAQTRGCPNGVVVNISLGTPSSTALNEAAEALVDTGVFVAVAAGN